MQEQRLFLTLKKRLMAAYGVAVRKLERAASLVFAAIGSHCQRKGNRQAHSSIGNAAVSRNSQSLAAIEWRSIYAAAQPAMIGCLRSHSIIAQTVKPQWTRLINGLNGIVANLRITKPNHCSGLKSFKIEAQSISTPFAITIYLKTGYTIAG